MFDLNRGSFILDSNAGVVCESFRIDDTSGFYFGNKSVLKINGTLTTSIINPEYGFFTYGSEYAVIQAEGIETKEMAEAMAEDANHSYRSQSHLRKSSQLRQI